MGPKLTPRLRAVADRVPEGARLADVGTDHAYLPVWLLLQGRIPSALCTDLRPGPLDRARETVARWGVADRTALRRCDGLDGVRPQEVDCVVIAGMGGETILHILARAPWVGEKTCLVQPMSSLPDLRGGLAALGLHVARETLAREGETLYVVLDLAPGPEGPLTAAERWVGRPEAHRGDPLWPEYLARETRRLRRALAGLERSRRPGDEPRRQELEAALRGLEQRKEERENADSMGHL